MVWDTTPLIAAVYHDQDSCLDIILDWMRSQGHEVSDETWLSPLKRAMLLGFQQGSLKTLVKLSYLIGIHHEFAGEPNQEKITMRQIGIALNSKYPLRTLLASEGVVIPQPDPCDAYAISIATASSYTDVVQTLLSGEIEIPPQLLVDSLFRGNTSDVTLIANRLCNSTGGESLSRFDILHEILLGAFNQQMILHDRHWQRSNHCKVRSVDLTNSDPFDLIWDTSVLDLQRSCLEWDFVDVILPHATAPLTSSSSPVAAGSNAAPGTTSSLKLQTLFLAIALRARGLVEKLIQYDPSLAHKTDANGRTALMAAVCTRSEDLTRLLLESLDEEFAAFTINAVSETGYSAIAYAIRVHHVGHVLYLLENSYFDVWSVFDEVVADGCPFVWALSMMGDNPICDFICKSLRAHPNPEKLSHATEQLRRLPKRIFLEEDRYRGCHESWKPLLSYAVIYRRLETFRFLLEAGADFEAPDGHGRTALSHAEESLFICDECKSMVKILLRLGADHLRLDHAQKFPLWYALKSQPTTPMIDDDFRCSDSIRWEIDQILFLSVNRPGFMRQVKEVARALFELAIVRCSSSLLELLTRIPRRPGLLDYVGTSDLSPLTKIVLSLNVILPIRWSEVNLPSYIQDLTFTWHRNVESFYMLLNRLEISYDIPDKDGKTALCHALDRLYAYHCSYSPPTSLQEFHYSEACTSALVFIIEELNHRDYSDPIMRNCEGYCPLDLALALLDQLKQGQARKSDQSRNGTSSSPPSSIGPDPLSQYLKKIELVESPSGCERVTAESALEALHDAINLLDTLDAADDSQGFDISTRKEGDAVEFHENTMMDERTKMKVIMAEINSEWSRKNAAEAIRLGTVSLWDEYRMSPSAPSAANASSTTANLAVREGDPGASTTATKPLGPAARNTNGAALARPGSSSESNGTSRKVSIDYEPVLNLSPALGFRMAQKNPVLFPKGVAQNAK